VRIFWDSSAVVPLLLEEANSASALNVWREAGESMAWEWLRVEVEAALIRRMADAATWGQWRSLQRTITFVHLEAEELPALLALNRGCGLRAADAGHLFVLDRLCTELPDLSLLTFDGELSGAARVIGLPVHTSCP
jgi:predicted nucleic acid-binding protein